MQDNNNRQQETRKWLYESLSGNGYDLGSYEDFDKHADEKETREWLYNAGKESGLELGSYADFDKGMGYVSSSPTSVAQQVIDEYDRANQSSMNTGSVLNDNSAGSPKIPGYDAVGRLYELMERNKPSLNELVKKNSQDKPESVNDRDTFQTPIYENALRVANRMRKEQAMRSEDYGYRPSIAEPIERKKNTFEQEEERRIDELYHPKKVENESDVLENYRNRFVLSIRGGKLDSELAEKRGEVEAKYLQAFTQSPEYQDLLRLGASAEEINEKFYQQYGDAINGELRPYENAIFQEMANRYRGRIQEEFTQLQKQRSTDQLKALAGEVDELSKQAHKNLQRRAPSSGNAMNALMGSRNYTQSSEEERRQVGMLNAAKRLIEQSQEIVAEAGKQGGTNFVAGLGRGLRDNMDWENFTFGLADMADALYLNNALEKYEAGNTLSEAEQKLLEASAVNMAIQGFYSSDLGRGYNAGRVTAESLPFMLEFIANPISGSSNAIAKSLLKFGLRRFGRAGSFAARVAGSTGAALGMTGTTGVPRVVSGTMERLNQNYDYYLDENGDLQVQKTGNVGTLEAMGKSIASTALENQSEMVLNAFRVFRPYLRQLEKALPGGVNSFMQMVKESRPGQLYREVKSNPTLRELVQRTQFQGFPQEYLEEVYSNFSNIPLGDMTLEEATDFDNNLDIILGLTPTFLAFGMIGVGSMATERYQNRKHMERIFGKMTDEQRKKFEELQRMSKINGNEDIKNFIKITMADPELTQEQKRDEIDYAFAIAKQNAMDEIQEAETQDRIDTETEDIAGHSDPSTNTYTEAERIYMNDVGEWVKETGYIVGWQDPEKERFPYWIPEGVEFTPENTRLLRPGEWDATTVKSMPTQEVIDETAQAIREDAAAQAQRESTYSPDIVPPSIGTTFTDGAAQYKIAQQNPDNPNGGWLATRTTVDEKGKPKEEVVEITDEQYYNAMQAQIDAEEAASRQEQQPVSSTNQAQSNGQSGSETAPSSLQGETSPGASETVIPTDEKGNLLYHRAPVDRTVSSINSEGLEPDEVDAFVQANKAASAKLLRNIEGKAPKMGTNIAQYKKAKQEWQARVDDAQAQVDYWNQVADAIQSQRTQVGDATAEDILSMGEPMDGHELAAQMLATGKLPLLQADFKRETGYKGNEARALFGLFASEANGGMTIERAGEQLMLADQEAGTNFFDQSDPNAGRNAILDVLSEVRTRGDLTNYIRRNREAMAERERQAEYDAYADWCDREMHMTTPEEYEVYQEYVSENNPYEVVAVEELDRIFAEAEEEIQTYLNQQDNGQQGTSENGSSPDSGPSERDEPAGAAGSRKAGVSVLPEAQPVLPGQVQGRTEGAASQPGPADDGVRAEEGTVSEGTSGGEGIENQINDENNEINVVSSQSNQNDTENEQGEVAGISGESSSLDGENEAATILRRAGDRTAASDGRGSWTKESLLGDVVRRSKESQTWIEDIQSIAGKHLLRGGENDVYLSYDGKSVIKVNDFSYLPDNSTNFDSFMNRVDAHNELFPNDAITILGFTRNSEGRISVVLSQPYIGNAREATQEEIDNFLEGMDFYTDMSGNWTDGTFDIADTKPNNVLVDADGNLHFIDVLPYDSRKPGKMLVIPPTRNAFVAPERQEGENLLDYAERVVKTKEIDDARKEVEANPTDAQKEAGNYRKGHITLDGYDITIENPKGSTRSGVDANGQSWSVTMNNDYGYIRGTEGVDGDHIDVFLSDDPTTGEVYVIDQVNADGAFDEHKVMYGFKSALAAKRAYLANYSPGWQGLGTITEVSKEEFKKWVESSHRKTKPFAEYKSVKVDGEQNDTIKTHQPNALPGRLMKAYESGNTALIASVEQEMREFVNSATDMRSVYSTYLRSKDLERAMEKGSPSNKTQHFIAETCKDVLKKAGLPTKAMQSERARTEIAGSMTDPHVLDIMSADTSFNVLRAIIHNPNTSESTLKHFTKVFSNNGLDYEAQQELDKRQSQNGDELRFREIQEVNERFNEKLSGLTEDNADKVTLDLGNPSSVLLAAGVEDKPMKLYGNKVIKKMKKHGFKLDELRNLPEAVAEPIAVFNNYGKAGNKSILTELETEQGNFLVTLTLGKGHDVDFNVVTSVFGKGESNIVDWINKGFATYIDKEKALDYLHHSALKAVTSDNQELSDATKIVENFENPIIDSEISRNGNVNLSDDALSTANDPVAKLLGKSTRTARQRKEFAERERRNMAKRVQELAEKLHLDNVEIVTEPMTITDRQGRTHHPKGFYNPRTGKIVIVVPNNVNTFDAEQTLLHEAVAHYGLRRLFGEHFDTFLDNVFNNADVDVRRKIVELAKKNGWDTRLATEEYLASLAENTNFEDLNASWWRKIKELFLRMLHKIGFDGFTGVTLSDNELRYILWRSYENLAEPGRYRSILGEAADIVKQNELKVGNYASVNENMGQVADARESTKAERIRKLGESKPVEITGNEIEPSDDLKQYKKNALEYGKKLRASYQNKDTGITVQLGKTGVKEVLNHDYKNVEQLQSIAAIPQIIENSIYIDSQENTEPEKNRDVSMYHYYVCGLKIGNTDYTVRAVIAEQPNGNRYYDHKLTRIEKGKLLDSLSGITTPGFNQKTSLISDIKDTKLFSILQTNDEENLLFRESTEENQVQNATDDMNDESPSPISTPTVQAWDKLMNSFGFQFSETSFDHLAAVEEFQKLVEKHSGKEIKSFENVYDQMIALSSKTKNEMEMFDSFILTPMNKAILKLVGEKPVLKRWSWDKGSLRDLAVYVEAKHGVERNRQMAVEKLAKDDKSGESILADWSESKKRINSQQNLSWIKRQQMLDEEAGKLGADLSKDYSGLSSLFKDKEKYKDGWNTAALKYVEEYEKSHSQEDIDGLWKSIELATDYALQKQYESGLVSKEYVERQKERFENYVPLRGFADEIAGDVYNYIGNEFYAGGNPVKTAGGRTSEAGNPFGSILNIAYSSMSVGNKNMAKLALYSLVVNHDTGGLAIPGHAWMVKYDELKNNKELSDLLVSPEISNGEETPEWVEAVPQFPEKATSEEITRVMNHFEEAMKEYQKKGDAKSVGKRAKIPYRTLYKERDQHDIPLFIAGDKYVITVTGNPRLAQAMNGLLNPDVNNDPVSVIGKKIQRFMAGAFTAQNASFAVANLSRDTIYANNQAFIRENFRYWKEFTKNQRLGFGDYPQMMRRLYKYRHNQLDMNDKTERLFKEFMENGGATGYTFINDQDEYAHEIAKQMKKLSRKTPSYITPQSALKLMFDGIEFAGQSAELVNRFAAYKTSREMGRPISRSVRDAKEITVNFNRKGAGMKTAKVNRSTEGKGLIAGFRPIDFVACLSQLGRSHIIFWNANMQGKRRTYLNFKEHPVKTTITLVANNLVLGAVVLPFLNNVVMPALYDLVGWSSGDDDEDYYDALTDWERTKNLCLRLPHGYWLKIPMAPDMSPWLSMGDAIGGSLAGKRELTYSDFAKSLVDVASPISINWSYGNKHFGLNFVPSVAQPYLQNMMNINFMGNPIYKTPFNARQGFIPEYKMVYRSTSPTLIELSRVSNLVTGGSDIKTSGEADWNPAVLQNMISGYTGGWGNTMLSIADLMLNTLKGEETSVAMSQVPLVSRFVISGNKDMQLRRVNSSFYKVKDFINEFEYDRKSLENAIREAGKEGNMLDVAKYQDELNQLFNSERCQKYVKLKAIENGVKSYEEWLNETPDDEMMQDMVIGLKKEGIEELNR
ncbi:MAG: hypothetical protein H9791_03540 [Candidatus Bacteroides intestinipullorum]|uniref:Uncharacterized protein n=1 Tax=Candidatus Bacteroides intestinipullorum TaxID=2838471 RepID=A0A9E2KFJ6_9BACE|nr:hypothetical protein [Candidatus Bacteroides intestinipullorum]